MLEIGFILNLLIGITAIFLKYSIVTSENAKVIIQNGTVLGVPLKSSTGRTFLAFRGVPYAKPPTGRLRFQPPQPSESWTGVLDATKDGNECPQVDFMTGGVKGNENCLLLNVYTTEDYVHKQLPVLVFIHGGGFVMGTGNSYIYSPVKFMDLDVVLVAMNYRLGMLGFLSTEDETVPGNYGMLDQVQALRWIQENIRNFGGNPEKVLVFGVSAGGGSVAHLVLSTLTKGLFHAAIAESGTTQSAWSLQRKPLSWAKKIAAVMNCPTKDTKAMVQCFRNNSVEDIVLKSESFHISVGFPVYFAPVVEVRGGQGFIIEDPLEALKAGRIGNPVPFITGVVKDEGFLSTHLMAGKLKSGGQTFFDEEFPTVYLPNFAEVQPNMRSVVQAIQQEYYKNRDVNDPQDFLNGFEEILADTMFYVGADVTLKYMARASVPTYAYRYIFESREGTLDTEMLLGVSAEGKVTHGEETHALFRVQFLPNMTEKTPKTEDEKFMQAVMTRVWKSFANNQKPSFVGTPIEDQSLQWVPYDADKPNYMQISKTPTMVEGQLSNRTEFWTEIVPRLVRKHKETREQSDL